MGSPAIVLITHFAAEIRLIALKRMHSVLVGKPE
jgi:hypothetical protein